MNVKEILYAASVLQKNTPNNAINATRYLNICINKLINTFFSQFCDIHLYFFLGYRGREYSVSFWKIFEHLHNVVITIKFFKSSLNPIYIQEM